MIAVTVLALLAGCGRSGVTLGTEESSTSTSSTTTVAASGTSVPTTTAVAASVAQPQCQPEGVRAYREADGAAQGELQGDLDAIKAYGAEHPDEFSAAGFSNDPTVRATGWFTGHLDQHRAALAARVPHPDKLAVLQGYLSERDSQALQQQVQDDAHLKGHWNQIAGGTATGIVTVGFNAARADRDAAAYARRTWGDKLCITIASHPYPHGAWTDQPTCPPAAPPESTTTTTDPGVTVKFALARHDVPRGESGHGTLTITNRSAHTVEFTTGGQGLGAAVLIPATGENVGTESGAHTLEARIWRAAPGDSIDVPVVFGTEDCRPNGQYALPAGTYEVRVGGSEGLPPAQATCAIVGE